MGLTIDCAQPAMLAEFWALALGYVAAPAPVGFLSWEEWLAHYGVPEGEWEHIDVHVGGCRDAPQDERWLRVRAAVQRSTAAGATAPSAASRVDCGVSGHVDSDVPGTMEAHNKPGPSMYEMEGPGPAAAAAAIDRSLATAVRPPSAAEVLAQAPGRPVSRAPRM